VIPDGEAVFQVVAVTGLAIEARIAQGNGVRAIACGGDARALARALERELARGARAVISFGIAGGLAEDIAAGTLVLARAIVTREVRWLCDARWSAAIARRLPQAVFADLAGVDTPVMVPAAKRALRSATRAAALDTESHIAAAIAAKHGMPFVAFRAVADSARRRLPPVAAVALTADGRVKRKAVLGSLARAPTQIPLVLRTAVDTSRALRALSRSRRLLGFGLACPDLDERVLDMS
jgi:adenosylhomocysteine nucleosidase